VRRLGVAPQHCVVIDDAVAALEAAARARMRAVVLHDNGVGLPGAVSSCGAVAVCGLGGRQWGPDRVMSATEDFILDTARWSPHRRAKLQGNCRVTPLRLTNGALHARSGACPHCAAGRARHFSH
jgi:hypothetical protein